MLHREHGGGAHVHVLAARCDLETGREPEHIAPPGWEKTFGPLRDAFNHERGWARPDDPARARVQQPGHRAYVEATQLRAGLRLEASPRDLIRDYLLQRVEHGTVRDRADVVSALRDAGLEVPRQGKDYLTALDPESGDRWRLKGELYGENFDRERFDRAAAETAEERAPGDRGVDRERAKAARENSRRVARNALRTIERDTEEATGRMRELLVKAWQRPLIVGLSLWLGFFGGSWATMRWLSRSIQTGIETRAELNRDIADARRTLAQLEEDTWGLVFHEIKGERFVVGAGRGAGRSALVGGRGSSGVEAVERVKALYERIGEAVDGGLEEALRAVRNWSSGGTPSRSKPCGSASKPCKGASSGKARRTKPCGSTSRGRAGRTQPCRGESSGWTSKLHA